MTGTLLRVFLREAERLGKQPLYVAVIEELRRNGFEGATVLKGIGGFGLGAHSSSIRTLDFGSDLPVVIEAIETEEHIRSVLPRLSGMIANGLLTLESVEYISVRRPAP